MTTNIILKICGAILVASSALAFVSSSASANTTDWIRLDRVAAFSKSVRSFGHNGLVTGVKCGIVDGQPSMRFTYELVSNRVLYNYAWSTNGESEFKARAKKVFKPSVKVLTCHMKNFYYGTQNIQ